MWTMLVFQVFLLGLILEPSSSSQGGQSPVVICTFKIPVPEELNPNRCTHGLYGFLGINKTHVYPYGYTSNILRGGFNNVTSLKEVNPKLKFLIHLWIPSTLKLEKLMTDSTRDELLSNLYEFLETNKFDGVVLRDHVLLGYRSADLDAETGLDILYKKLNSKGYIVVTSLPNNWENRTEKQIRHLSDYSDLIYVTLSTNWDKISQSKPQHPHALYSSPEDFSSLANVNSTIGHLIENGADSHKLILSLYFYGHVYKARNTSKCPTVQGNSDLSLSGQHISDWTIMNRNMICMIINESVVHWDNNWKAPFICRDSEVIYYEDERSLREKLHYIKDHGLGGVGVSVENAGFTECGTAEYHYLEVINEVLADPPTKPRSRSILLYTSLSLLTVAILAGTVYVMLRNGWLEKRGRSVGQFGYRFIIQSSEI